MSCGNTLHMLDRLSPHQELFTTWLLPLHLLRLGREVRGQEWFWVARCAARWCTADHWVGLQVVCCSDCWSLRLSGHSQGTSGRSRSGQGHIQWTVWRKYLEGLSGRAVIDKTEGSPGINRKFKKFQLTWDVWERLELICPPPAEYRHGPSSAGSGS